MMGIWLKDKELTKACKGEVVLTTTIVVGKVKNKNLIIFF